MQVDSPVIILLKTVIGIAALLLFARPLPWHENRRHMLGCSLFLALLYCFRQTREMGFFPDFLFTALLVTCFLRYVRCREMTDAFYSGIAFFMVLDCGRAVSLSLTLRVLCPLLGWTTDWQTGVASVLSYAIILPLALVTGHFLFPRDKTASIGLKHYLLLMLPMLPFAVLRQSNYLYNNPDRESLVFNVILLVLISFSTLLSLIGNKYILEAEAEKNRRLEMERLLREQHQQYITRSESIELLNKRYHDLKHYLAALPELARAEDLEKQVDIIRKELQDYEYYRQTGNPIVDVILSEKLKYCGEHGIRLTAYVDAREMAFIDSLSLCALFGNSLDNAIEAVQKVPAELREIHIKAGERMGMLVITVSNYYTGTIRLEKGLPKSTKQPGQGGWGLKNIRAAVEKYGGTCSTDITKDRFTLNLVIPKLKA